MGMSTNTENKSPIVYLGPTGAGFGFQISGIDVRECVDTDDMVGHLKKLVGNRTHDIIFVDEGLAAQELETVQKLNQQPLPAIILLPNPAQPKRMAAENLQQLMVRAIGSDIFSNQ